MSKCHLERPPCPSFIAFQIKYWRKKNKFTQAKVSKLSGIKLRHYQEIEAGRIDMKIRTLGHIAKALNMPPYKLLTPVGEFKKNMCNYCQRFTF